MTDAVALGLIGGVPLALTALGNLYVSIRNGGKITDAKDAAAQTTTKVDNLADGQKVIHELVNSNLTKVKDDLAEAKREIVALRQLIATFTNQPHQE